MYITPNDRAVYLYSGMIGAFLNSNSAGRFDRDNHPWELLQNAGRWLQENNPLFRQFGGLFNFVHTNIYIGLEVTNVIEANRYRESRLPQVFIEDQTIEPSIPSNQPDIVVDPFNYENEVRNEDFRYHRLAIGVLEGGTNVAHSDSIGEIQNKAATILRVINHGDQNVEALLFPTLYPEARGQWRYIKCPNHTFKYPSLCQKFRVNVSTAGHKIMAMKHRIPKTNITQCYRMQRSNLTASYLISVMTGIGQVGFIWKSKRNGFIKIQHVFFE